MKSSIKLNKEQIDAINTPYGNLLIVASAGTGKTTTLVERYINLIENYNYYPGDILMTTFTNKAAKDMIENNEIEAGKELLSQQLNHCSAEEKAQIEELLRSLSDKGH